MEDIVPLNPIGRQDIHKLETVLLISALFDPEIIEKIKDPKERVTWIDSLAVAAGAFARRKANMTISEIAEELGRTESTIRNHLEGKTEAGKIINKVYQRLLENEGKIEFKLLSEGAAEKKLQYISLKVDEIEKKLQELVELFDDLKKSLQ